MQTQCASRGLHSAAPEEDGWHPGLWGVRTAETSRRPDIVFCRRTEGSAGIDRLLGPGIADPCFLIKCLPSGVAA